MDEFALYDTPPIDKADLIQRILRSRAALDGYLDGLSVDSLAQPGPEGWSVKDHLAHIAAWERLVLELIAGRSGAAIAGMTDDQFEDASLDAINDAIRRRHAGTGLDAVLDEYHATHGRLLDAVSLLTDDRLAAPAIVGNPRSLMQRVAGNTFAHYLEHLEWIRELQE